MTSFALHTIDTAPAASQPLLAGAVKAYGFVPNLLAGMAESPALLEGYMTLAGIFGKTALTETERQIIVMTASRLNGCTYCMAAHTTLSQGAKVPADVIAALRDGAPIANARLEALRQFTMGIVQSRGWPTERDIDALLAAGYSRQSVFDVILGVALKLMSNYTNHVAGTPLDARFQGNAWSARPQEEGALA